MSEKREKEKLTLHSLNLNLLTRVRSLESKLAQVTAENERLGNIASEYEHEIDCLKTENTRYREALEFCSAPTGAFSIDHGQHAKNCIGESMKIAKAAINGPTDNPSPGEGGKEGVE